MATIEYPFDPIVTRRTMTWPRGAHVAVIVTVALECWDLHPAPGSYGGPQVLPIPIPPGIPDYPNFTWREYGQRIGIWRVFDVLDRHGIKASCPINTEYARRFPLVIDAAKKRGWEFVAHSALQSDLLSKFANDRAAEEKFIAAVFRDFAELLGERPRGWISPAFSQSPNTLSILAELGIRWFSDFGNDDQPYRLTVDGREVLCIPQDMEFPDLSLLLRKNFTTREYEETLKEQFSVLYAEGATQARLMNLIIHPYALGRAEKIRSVDRVLAFMRKHGKVWFPLRDEIADWYLSGAAFPAGKARSAGKKSR
jgi:peptidoglycan/xylan/chitin deacetylase (PgdA/CDA1 family)